MSMTGMDTRWILDGYWCMPERALSELSAEECDVLMKYVYRGLATKVKDQEHYKTLLKWHPKVLAIAGPASIVRAMAEVSRPL